MDRSGTGRRLYQPIIAWIGLFCIAVSLLELFVFHQPDFYAFFSLGATLFLVACHDALAERPLFAGWNAATWSLFLGALLLFCVIIDQTGMQLGFWRYPHYGVLDELRKYLFEWAAALVYHMAAYRAGRALLRRIGLPAGLAAVLSLVVGVTLVGLITEWLNLYVLSWEVLSMPFTDAAVGPFFFVFQTIGYWLMVIFPYAIYLVVDSIAIRSRAETPSRAPEPSHPEAISADK